MGRVSVSVRLRQPPADVWAGAIDPDWINDELRPILEMRMPRGVRGRDLSQYPIGTPVGRSWILLFGVVPVDYDDLCLVELEPPRRFLERSSTLSFSTWEHERVIEPDRRGSILTDRLSFELRPLLRRLPGSAALATVIVSRLFAHRHRRLRKRDTAQP